jgi:putative glycosyltransferase (TIGR04372 family)
VLNLKKIIRKAASMMLWLPLLISFAPISILVYLIGPIFLFRFHGLNARKIGHYAEEVELYLCEIAHGINRPKLRYWDIFFHDTGPVCNKQLEKMWRRKIPIFPKILIKPMLMLTHVFPGGGIHRIGNNTQYNRDVNNLYDKISSQIEFTSKEISYGMSVIEKMGLKEKKYVCIDVRDSAYANNVLKVDNFRDQYRDSNIENYYDAALKIIEKGYVVVRMGKSVNSQFPVKNSNIIDYANSKYRSDFMDLFLAAYCDFTLSGCGGFSAVPIIFRRPFAFVNMAPIGLSVTFRGSTIGICKHYCDLHTHKRLTLKEIVNRESAYFSDTKDFIGADIYLAENSSEEIMEVAEEMIGQIEGTLKYSSEDNSLQEIFRNNFPKDEISLLNNSPQHGKIKFRYGAKYLLKNPNFLN